MSQATSSIVQQSAYPAGRRGSLLRRAFRAGVLLVSVANRALFILEQFPVGVRGEILRSFLRLQWHHFLRKLNPSRQYSVERLFGRPFATADHLSLVGMFDCMFLEREYEFRARHGRPRIVDCGSNVGLSLLWFKRQYPESRILAFEPDLAAFAMLQRNAAQFGWQDVELHNQAVLDKAGTVDFYVDPQQPASVLSSVHPGCGLRTVRPVEAVPLSSFITEQVDLLKLDIEGAEHAVLEELAQAGKLPLVREIILEYHHHLQGGEEDRFSHMLRLLEDHGFGYELSSYPARPFQPRRFSCVMVYAYRKSAC